MTAPEEAEREGRAAARKFRTDNGLGVGPLGDLVALIEQTCGVDVTMLAIDDADEHGLTMVDPARGAAIVAVACSDRPMRWRSNLAHELGHLVLGDHDSGQPGRLTADPFVEQRARAFARHVLVPVDGISRMRDNARGARTQSADHPGLALLSDVVQHFQASPRIVTIQLRDLGLIDDALFAEWSSVDTPALAARFGWTDQYATLQHASRQHRAPQRLLTRAVAGYIAGLVSLETVASVRGVTPHDLALEFEAAGIAPAAAIPQPEEDEFPDPAGVDIDLSWLDDE
ncbi:ImmA/IrrE family metallo-endopeptidase [Luteipulveratus halotolerans]|uniref:IrrE N-terminal-like domain-containing protein n=1 Tax=Luteipulveratus halotolerans TaxID=1631356 RepID=A0A0L6CMH1_9MICO|nr:ImmA/IrrE family metallo-endopeptidase [Luteipulveratus halotolerans]KNX38850.1 hypothetical protein VV01_19675 [Luteipulveratus halotolerans]